MYNIQASGHCFDRRAIATQVPTITEDATNPSKTATPMPGLRVLVGTCQRPSIFPVRAR